MAAAAVLSACGGSSAVTFSTPSTTTTTGSTPGATTGAADTLPIDTLLGPQGIDYESNPALAPVNTRLTGAPIRGIQCQTLRQLAYQDHAHLQIYVRGKPRALPGGIGMVSPQLSQTSTGPIFTAGTCYYWLHTVTQDGVIEVGSPLDRRFTIGQLFALWGQPLSRRRVGPARGRVTVLLDGHRWRGDPSALVITEHASIEFAVGEPVPHAPPVNWATSQL